MEDTALHWHHCQGMSLGPYEGDDVFGYLLYIFVTCSKKGHYILKMYMVFLIILYLCNMRPCQ